MRKTSNAKGPQSNKVQKLDENFFVLYDWGRDETRVKTKAKFSIARKPKYTTQLDSLKLNCSLCMGILSPHMYVHHMCAMPSEAGGWHQIPWNLGDR